MRKLNCAIFAGDAQLQETLLQRINNFDTIEVVRMFSTPIEMIEELNSKKPDILFVNTDFANFNAVETLKLIQRPAFIFAITSNKLQTAELIDNGFFDVINPKLDIEIFCKKICKLLNISNSLLNSSTLVLKEPPMAYSTKKDEEPVSSGFVYLSYQKVQSRIEIDNIALVTSTRNGLKIHLIKGKPVFHSSTMKKFAKILPPEQFVKINKSTIINFSKMERIEQNKIHINKQTFVVSRIFAPKLKEMIRQNSIENNAMMKTKTNVRY